MLLVMTSSTETVSKVLNPVSQKEVRDWKRRDSCESTFEFALQKPLSMVTHLLCTLWCRHEPGLPQWASLPFGKEERKTVIHTKTCTHREKEMERPSDRQRGREIEWDRVDWERKEVVYHKENEIQRQHTRCQTSNEHKRQHRQKSLSNVTGQGKNLGFSSTDLQLNSCPLPRVHWRMLMMLTEPSADPDLVDKVHTCSYLMHCAVWGRSRRIPGSDSCSHPTQFWSQKSH